MRNLFSEIRRLRFLAIAAFAALWSCELDQGLGPSETRISGTIVFTTLADSSLRPDNIDEVRVVAVASLPPAGFGDIYFSNPVRFGLDTATYEIAAPLGDYPAIGVLWKPRGRDWLFTSLLGIYGLELPFKFEIKPVSLTKAQPVAEHVDTFAYWDLTRYDARIEGELTLRGEWPAETEYVLVGAFKSIPNLKDTGTLLLQVIEGGLPLPVSNGAIQRPYGLAVRGGEYKFIGVFWIGKTAGLEVIRVLGYYRNPQDASLPGNVLLDPKGAVKEINVIADFSTLPEGLPLPDNQ